MRISPTSLSGPMLLEPTVHGDDRGFFVETFRREEQALLDVSGEFIQDNHSRSRRGVVRGMHFHVGEGVAKLVRCGRGRIWDVVVDIRQGSPSYGAWEGFELDDAQHRQLYVPVGFAHGFCTLSDVADVMYRQTAYYSPDVERGIAYDDPALGIEWPIEAEERIVSARDAAAPTLAGFQADNPFVYGG